MTILRQIKGEIDMNLEEMYDEILKNGIDLEEFIERINMSECRNYCRNLSRVYMFEIQNKCQNNPRLKEALDYHFEHSDKFEECPHCGEEIIRR